MRTIVIIILLLVGALGYSQDNDKKAMYWGIIGGGNLSSIRKLGKAKTGITTGFYFEKSLSNVFNIDINLLYFQKGCNSLWTITNNGYFDGLHGVKISLNYNYLVLPICFKVQTKKKVFFKAGLFTGYLLNAKVKEGQDIKDDLDSRFNDRLKRFDYGIILGLGYGIPIRDNIRLQLEAIENYGIQGIYIKDSPSDIKLKTNAIELRAGLNLLI